MAGGARQIVPDACRAARQAVDHRLIGEHRPRGDVMLRIANISAEGFLAVGASGLGKGERVIVRLPVIGRIEAFLTWTNGERAGFQFERVLRREDFARLVEALKASSARAAASPRGSGPQPPSGDPSFDR